MSRWQTSRRFRWAVILALDFLVGSIVLLTLPRWLITTPQTPPSDVILHHAIASNTDADGYVVQLYRQGIGKKIVCIALSTPCETFADYARQHLLALGVPAEDVLTLPLPGAACLAPNLPRFTELMKTHHWQQAVLVLHPQVSRTDGAVARKYFQQAGLGLAITHAPGQRASYTPLWWTKYETAQAAIDALVNGTLDRIYPECR